MTHNISRRTLAKGVGWSAPTLVATTAIPAFAASPTSCSTTAINAIDAAFTEMATATFTAYWTEPTVGLADGFSKVPSFNIINNSSYDVELSGTQGLVVQFDAVRANGDTRLPNGPLTAATSWGETSSVTQTVVDGQAARSWTWTATGKNLVGNASGNDNISDTNFSTGTNIDGTATWGNDGTVHTLFGGAVAWPVGSSVWSNVSGNYRSDTYPPGVINNATGISNNGIF